METMTVRDTTQADILDLFDTHHITPIRVFDNFPLWKPITIDPTRPPRRNGGTGLIGLHLDFINASNPPDVAAFYCETGDEGHGGQNIIVDVRHIPPRFDIALAGLRVSHGLFHDLSHVGHDINPFPVLDGTWVRYGDGLSDDLAYRHLGEWLWDHIEIVDLAPGDALVVNQHTHLHGRLPVHGVNRVLQSIYGRA